jgi:hypothetical protein
MNQNRSNLRHAGEQPMSSYHEVYAAWKEEPEAFWAQAAREITWFKPWEKVFDDYQKIGVGFPCVAGLDFHAGLRRAHERRRFKPGLAQLGLPAGVAKRPRPVKRHRGRPRAIRLIIASTVTSPRKPHIGMPGFDHSVRQAKRGSKKVSILLRKRSHCHDSASFRLSARRRPENGKASIGTIGYVDFDDDVKLIRYMRGGMCGHKLQTPVAQQK